ncbi:MAG: hypothetical protein V2B20_18460 [Pseudomonadota bacterium]
MVLEAQKQRFYQQVLPSHPNEWEVDAIFTQLAGLDPTLREALLNHVPAIWPVSHSLCFAYLTEGAQALCFFPPSLLEEWVRGILSQYESRGLIGAREYMVNVDKYFLGPKRGEAGVNLGDIGPMMRLYICGVAEQQLEIGAGPLPATDTRTIYLPPHLDVFAEKDKNILLYKLLVSLQWGQIASRLYIDVADRPTDAQLPSEYPDTQLAIDLLALLQFLKVYRLLARKLPGLIGRGRELCLSIIKKIRPTTLEGQRCQTLRDLLNGVVGAENERESRESNGDQIVLHQLLESLQSTASLELLPNLYEAFIKLPGGYRLGAASLLFGEFDFHRASVAIVQRREEDRQKFVKLLAAFLRRQQFGNDNPPPEREIASSSADTLLLMLLQEKEGNKRQSQSGRSTPDGPSPPEELATLARGIEKDLGTLPEAYLQAAAGLAGGGLNRQEGLVDAKSPLPEGGNFIAYDEWDWRRNGYRKRWCSLYEKTLAPVHSTFVAATLGKYRSQVRMLRDQFGMLRPSRRVVRRRRHGDDIDLDALIEALGDSRAGLPPSDRLFTRALRIERDITVLFLVDMSNSTEGWVSLALKEALVILAEALEAVGDRYGIYGFSGMRRSKCEFYHIKHPEESYGETVQRRIAAITPREYTPYGPTDPPSDQEITGNLKQDPSAHGYFRRQTGGLRRL